MDVTTAPGAGPDRWFGVGHSTAANVAEAGDHAARAALAGRDADLLLVFASLDHDFAGLLAAVRAHAGPGTAIVGCSTCGELVGPPAGPVAAASSSVVVVALGGPGVSVRTALSREAAGRQRAAGAEIATSVGQTGRPHEALMLIPDGLIGRQHDLIRGAYSVVGAAVPLVGGCAGDLTYARTYQFHGDRNGVEVVTGGVVGVLIGSTGPIGIGTAHGWRPTGPAMNITGCDDNRIYRLDDQPALDVYLRRVNADESIMNDPAGFFTFTHAYPLGVSRRSGEDIRVIQAADLTDRSVTCFADVQEGMVAWVMETDRDALADGAADSCRQALRALGGAQPIGVIEFDCAVRKIQLGPDGVDEEVAGITEVIGGAPLAGFYSMGEISRTRGIRGMHHMTSVSLVLG